MRRSAIERGGKMSIITISRGSYSQGETIARKVAAKLGYECLSREVLLQASQEFNIPEVKLVRAIHDAPSILERFRYGREKYIAYIEAAILKHVIKDNVVYHGLAGHFFLKNISHVLKVRVLADLEERVRREMATEGISYKEALRILREDDEQRRRWSRDLYGIDTTDPSLYDLVIHVKRVTADDAVEIIIHTLQLPQFQATPDSQSALEDLALAAEVKAVLVGLKPDVEVAAKQGVVSIRLEAAESQESALMRDLERTAKKIEGIKEVKFEVSPIARFSD
jgi:cytidylate kinase